MSDRDGAVIGVFGVAGDDVVRQGILSMIDGQVDMTIVGHALDSDFAISTVTDSRPDIVMIDAHLVRPRAIDARPAIRAACPSVTCVLIASMVDERALVEAALAGAATIVPKQLRGSTMVDAIRAVAKGARLFDFVGNRHALGRLTTSFTTSHQVDVRQLLELMSTGRTTVRIADELGLDGQDAARLLISCSTTSGCDRPITMPDSVDRRGKLRPDGPGGQEWQFAGAGTAGSCGRTAPERGWMPRPHRGATVFSTVILPLDDSPEGHRAIRPAAVVAERFDATIQVVNAIPDMLGPHAPATAATLGEALGRRGALGTVDVLAGEDVPGVVTRWVSTQDEPLVVMATSSGGRARDVVVGSTAERLVHQLAAPILLVGPEVDEEGPIFGGPVVIAVGTEALQPETIALVRAWVDAVDAVAWVVTVVDPSAIDDGSSGPSSTVERHAEILGGDLQWEVLHGDDPAVAVVAFAARMDAGSIITTTHGRVGFERLVAGSTAFAIAHQARCPVLVHQPFTVVAHQESASSD